MPTHKETGRNRNNEYVHQTIESYLEWWEKAYKTKKTGRKMRTTKISNSENYIFKRDHKEIIISFD